MNWEASMGSSVPDRHDVRFGRGQPPHREFVMRELGRLKYAALILCLLGVACEEGEPDTLVLVADSAAADLLAGPPPVAGLVIAVGRGDEVVFDRVYGVSDPETGAPLDPSRPMRISSITKQFTAAAVLRLAEQERIDLDAPIHEYLSDFRKDGSAITVRHLLTHTSGLPNYAALLGGAGRAPAAREVVLDTLRRHPAGFAVGERFGYSNSNYYLLGLVLEAVTGGSYADHLQAEFFDRLGLEQTHYCRVDGPASLVGYRASADGLEAVELRDTTDYLGGSGGLCSTASDLVRWQLALASGEAIGASSYEQMTTPALLESGEPSPYGMGAFIEELEGAVSIVHSGSLAGFNGRIAYYPEQEIAVAVLSNTGTPKTEAVRDAVARAALGLARVVPTDLPLAPQERARYIGSYDLGPLQLRVLEQAGRLVLQPDGQAPARLLYQGEHTFLAEAGGGARIDFVVEDGRATRLILYQGSQEMTAERIQP